MLGLGLRVKINSTLTAWNEGELEGMLAIADGLGLRIQLDPEVTPRDDGDREPLSVSASEAGVAELFRLQAERARRAAASSPGSLGSAAPPASSIARGGDDGTVPAGPGKHCGAGSAGIAVDPFGNVYPCVQWRRPVGNLHQQSIRDIWTGSRDLAEVRDLTIQVKERVDAYGPRGPLLNFCPGAADTRTGDPLAVYPEAERRAALLERAILPILP
jgi:MoaA/NifB/PqqE/SkfB family radical SAM enzyme